MIYGSTVDSVKKRKIIMDMLATGFVNKQIGRRFGIKERTVETSLYRMRKLNGAKTTYHLMYMHFLHKYDYHK